MATAYIKVNSGSENIYTASGTKSDTDETITYNASTKTITLNNYTGGDISTNVAGLYIACSSTSSSQKATGTNGTSTTLSAAVTIDIDTLCPTATTTTIPNTSTSTTTTTNPETFDPIIGYIMLAIFSVAAIIARKFYYAKH